MKAPVSREKALEILHDGAIRGHPISKKQRGLFGAISHGAALKGLHKAHARKGRR